MKETFQGQIDAATQKAEGGKIKEAYNDLNAVKTQARKAANTERAGATVQDVEHDLGILEGLVRRLLHSQSDIRDSARDSSQLVMDRATSLTDPSTHAKHEDVVRQVTENIAQKKEIHIAWDGTQSAVNQKLKTFKTIVTTAPTPNDLIASVSHKMALLNKADPNASALPHNARFLNAESLIRTHSFNGKGNELQAEIDGVFKARRDTLFSTLATKTASPPATQFTDSTGVALTGQAAKDAATEMAERFKVAEAQEAKILERAKAAYLDALKTDRAYLGMTEDTAPIVHAEVRKFSTADLLEDVEVDVHDTTKTPAALADLAATELDKAFDALMQTVPANVVPDEVFDMCSKSLNDWKSDIASAGGLTFDPENPGALDGTLLAKVEAVAQSMFDKAQEKYPNKSKFDQANLPTEVTIGGETYTGFTKLGEGGGGTVYVGKSATGEEIVLKTPIGFDASEFSPKQHAEMAKEAAGHRAASGGELDPCHDNVLDMKGMVLAPDGTPLVAMDLAKGGDAKDYTNSMAAAEASGLITPQAKQAMMAAQIKDMLRGVKAMQDRGMTHHDLKDANVFMAEDGTFKVADFGLTRHIETRDGKVTDLEPHEFTKGYQPPEFQGEGAMSAKSDNFTLGVMLHRMTDPYGGKAEFTTSFGTYDSGLDQRRDSSGEATKASSLDRLMNSLLDPDPSKRPTLEAALQSSFLHEMETSHTKEDLDRLRAATAKYTATVGKETKRLNQEIVWEEGQIIKLEESKSDAGVLREIDFYERGVQQRQGLLRDLTRELNVEFDEAAKAKLTEEIDSVKNIIATMQKKKNTAEAKLGTTKTASELEQIESKITQLRKRVIDFRKQIDEVHKKPEFKDIVEELDAANKAFA